MAVLVAKRYSRTRKLAPGVVLLAPMVPDLSIAPLVALGAISVAIVALVQGAGISTAYPNPSGAPASASRDFAGQGIGNLAELVPRASRANCHGPTLRPAPLSWHGCARSPHCAARA